MLGDGVEQGHRLQAITRGSGPGLLDHATLVDRVLDAGHDQALSDLGHAPIAILDGLREVVAGIDVHDRERETRRSEGLLGEAQEDDRILAPREEQDRRSGLRRDLAHDGDRLRLERIEVAEQVSACLHQSRGGISRWIGSHGARS